MTSPPEIGYALRRLITGVGQAARLLAEAGNAVPATHARMAARHLEAATLAAERDRRPPLRTDDADEGGDAERLVTLTGVDTGVSLVPGENGWGRQVRPGGGKGEAAPARIPCVTLPDPGWDLLNSPAAREFATDDVCAALLGRALSGAGWFSPEAAMRWRSTAPTAALVVRLMRDGRRAPELRTPRDPSIDAGVVELLGTLGWRPERRDQIGQVG